MNTPTPRTPKESEGDVSEPSLYAAFGLQLVTYDDYKTRERQLTVENTRLREELKQALQWKEEDPRMLREQCRIADVSYNALMEHKNALEQQLQSVTQQLESSKIAEAFADEACKQLRSELEQARKGR